MHAAPLPLLGTFHEFSVATASLRPAIEFYQRLGFEPAPTSDAFTHPYAALTDGRLCIGLHDRAGDTPVLSFVRPQVAEAVAGITAAGLKSTFQHLGTEVFNEVGFRAGCGQVIALLEARTYSPSSAGGTCVCGVFAEISLPVADFAAAQTCWERLGFVAADLEHTPYERLPLTSDFLDLAFHDPKYCPAPLLVFEADDMPDTSARLTALGAAPEEGPGPGTLRVASPAGTLLIRGPPTP